MYTVQPGVVVFVYSHAFCSVTFLCFACSVCRLWVTLHNFSLLLSRSTLTVKAKRASIACDRVVLMVLSEAFYSLFCVCLFPASDLLSDILGIFSVFGISSIPFFL